MNDATSATLIERIHDLDDQQAWDRLFQIYAPLIRIFAMKKECPESSHDDVIQQTFRSLIKVLSKSRYRKERGKFRTLLYRLTSQRIADVFKSKRNNVVVNSETQYNNVIENLQDPGNIEPCEYWDDHWKKNLMAQGYNQVRKNIRDRGDPMTLEIFDGFFFKQLPAKKVALAMSEKYGLSVNENKIHQDKSRVLAMWKQEVKKLKEEFGE